jgi:hypothetical protein
VAELLGVASAAEARWSSPASGPVGNPASGPAGNPASGPAGSAAGSPASRADLLAERELWRVEAARGRLARFVGPHASGVFDLCFDWATGQWTLTHTLD